MDIHHLQSIPFKIGTVYNFNDIFYKTQNFDQQKFDVNLLNFIFIYGPRLS